METADVFDSEEMAAAFVNVSLPALQYADRVDIPVVATDSSSTHRFRLPRSRAQGDGAQRIYP